ncbi:DNA-processing protein DprA [Telmatospirillum siberiense]|uniref:DNA-protecting protein DprA n=1 Tax=Telmatospirillum siberiense TaxID=382514 RepID=A0A2N3PM58_9PROT|nr:DNA-processing protein DprA [Telmatospirillum siberiense]PKU21472.1 DNA-protecting protein DprA [Telmatospirillum siberiense]
MGEQQRILSDAERRDWLRLYRSENVGPATFFRLLDRFGTPAKALEMLPGIARRGGQNRPLRICGMSEAERELDALRRLGARLIASVESDFPKALKPLDTAPLITVRGRAALLNTDAVAIVGARNASALGRRMAKGLAIDLGGNGFVVVSGMARGIDTAAHDGALPTGTIAVLAGGVDNVYPQENRGLYERLCAEGCVISEMAPGTVPQATHFPRRNRLISGLARGIVVVEAAPKSGSLITARMALDQGRDVFAVPGSPFDPRCQGTNGLIKQGAILVETAADVLDVLSPPGAFRHSSAPAETLGTVEPAEGEMSQAREIVIPALSFAPVTVDEIIRQCQLSPAVVSMVLIELELAGRLERHSDNRISLLP